MAKSSAPIAIEPKWDPADAVISFGRRIRTCRSVPYTMAHPTAMRPRGRRNNGRLGPHEGALLLSHARPTHGPTDPARRDPAASPASMAAWHLAGVGSRYRETHTPLSPFRALPFVPWTKSATRADAMIRRYSGSARPDLVSCFRPFVLS